MNLTLLPPDAVPGTFLRRATDRATFEAAQDRWIDHDSPGPGHEGPSPMRRSTEFYRAVWREQIPSDTDRSLFMVLMPPGPSHIHGVRSCALATGRETALLAGFWAAVPIDYYLRVSGVAHLDVSNARALAAPAADHPLADSLLLRTLRLNCLTDAYAPLWESLAVPNDSWVVNWPGARPLADATGPWTAATPLRTELERRAALVEIDALAAVWLGLTADQLTSIYRARFPILYDYESVTWFDARGRKLAGNFNTYGSGQTKEHWQQFTQYLEDPDAVGPPQGFTVPFYKADREREMREAHAVFAARLKRRSE